MLPSFLSFFLLPFSNYLFFFFFFQRERNRARYDVPPRSFVSFVFFNSHSYSFHFQQNLWWKRVTFLLAPLFSLLRTKPGKPPPLTCCMLSLICRIDTFSLSLFAVHFLTSCFISSIVSYARHRCHKTSSIKAPLCKACSGSATAGCTNQPTITNRNGW